uniref:Uncharacterized protein n=1 Tax=Mycena chlorophos TaxID=658473 RepID=A0ABQ0LZJ3_MYCCL|nr:predicted protein [Mycena chlorophos]
MAPYDPSMRLGIGYNTFTQELCARDVVKTTGNSGSKAPAGWTSSSQTVVVPSPPSETPRFTNQQVQSTVQFIPSYIELVDTLGISAASHIKHAAAGGPYAAFLDLGPFRTHHLHYLIRVLATREAAVGQAAEFTDIDVIPNLTEKERVSVYGDCFISGFNEGGELVALVSVKLNEPTDANIAATKQQIEQQLHVGLATKTEDSKQIAGETRIVVLKRCGGVPDPRTEWSLAVLKDEIRPFPKHAFAHPVRISPVLTNYSTLKSFHVARAQNKFSVPQYTKNGVHVYAGALLEAFVEYQLVMSELQKTIHAVERGDYSLTPQPEVAELVHLSADAQAKSEASRVVKQEDADWEQPSIAPSTAGGSSSHNRERSGTVNSKWFNCLSPYPATVLGLQQARLDCRTEMMRIVDQIDLITEEPDLASTFGCFWENRSPTILRTLLPTVNDLVQQRLEAKKESAKVEALTRESQELKQHGEGQKRRAEKLAGEKKELEDEKQMALGRIGELEAAALALVSPYAGWSPIGVPGKDAFPIRFISMAYKKVLDYAYSPGSQQVHQWDKEFANLNQKFELVSESPKGYYIRHCLSGRYLSPGKSGPGDTSAYMEFSDFPAPFVFKRAEQDTGTMIIHFAENPAVRLSIERNAPNNGIKIIARKGAEGIWDQWRVELFA